MSLQTLHSKREVPLACPSTSQLLDCFSIANPQPARGTAQHNRAARDQGPTGFTKQQTGISQKSLPTLTELTRRNTLFGSLAGICFVNSRASQASTLRSLKSDRPGALTLRNELEGSARVYWLNYDGDPEFFAALPPGGFFTVDTFETHPWRIINAANGAVVQDYVAVAGEQQLTISSDLLSSKPRELPSQQAQTASTQEPDPGSFDGIGGGSGDYASAQLDAVTINGEGAVATLKVDGYSSPMPLYVGVAEAAAILYASGMEFRRPSTVNAWRNSLKMAGADVKRILVTRLVGNTYYARILLGLPGGSERSVDARPSDSLALALQCSAPVFVSKQVASNNAKAPLEKLLREEDGRQLGPGIHAEELREGVPGLDA